MIVPAIQEEKQQFVDAIVAGSPLFQRLQSDALEQFLALPFPTKHDENWRFTNLQPVLKTGAWKGLAKSAPIVSLHPYLYGTGEKSRLVFVNGFYSADHSRRQDDGLRIGRASDFASEFLDHAGKYTRGHNDVFVALNAAMFQDAAVVFIPAGYSSKDPIHLIFVSSADDGTISNPRVLIIAGEQSSTNIVEVYASEGNNRTLTNAVTEVVLLEGSTIEHTRIQAEGSKTIHIATTETIQRRDSTYTSFVFTLGAELMHQELNARIDGPGANCSLNGLYLLDGSQHADHETTIDHIRPHGTSQELYKGILAGKSHAIFNGKIIVRKDAQQSNAKQTNRNLLLSNDARINTKPQLEILADDVKCNHGATIGHLEEDALFYLRSRGMSEQQAQRILMGGFVEDVLSRMQVESVKNSLNAEIQKKLRLFVEN